MMGGAVKYLSVGFLAAALAAMAFWEAGVAAEGRLPGKGNVSSWL